jgi:ribosomal protein S27E
MMVDDKIRRLPVRAKPRPDEVALRLVTWDNKCHKCDHTRAGFVVDESLLVVECGSCGEKLNPVWAMARLCEQESLWRRMREAYIHERKELAQRVRTKCQHCGQMTRIRGL